MKYKTLEKELADLEEKYMFSRVTDHERELANELYNILEERKKLLTYIKLLITMEMILLILIIILFFRN